MVIDVVGNLFIMLFCVYLLAIISDSFFIISLDRIARELKLSDEVAGASLMAVGSSAPELCIALIALAQGGGAHSDVGIGTIVGSAVFNILVITGLAAIIANDLKIDMFDVRRDTFYYLASIAYLFVIFYDGKVNTLEAVVGIVAYIGYVILLITLKDPTPSKHQKTEKEPEPTPYPHSTDNLYRKVEGVIVRGIKMITGAPSKNYVWTFFVAIVFIVLLSYVLVEATINFAVALNISPVIVALTLLAAGTSAPDLISSIDVAKDGRGGMAVANAIGSDIFDVFIGLGVPWLIALLVLRPGEDIIVGTDGLWMSIFLLVGTVLVLYVFLSTQRTLTRREGVILLLLYAAYIIYTIAATPTATTATG
jgi:K+-dependent Na+/Ca+ exchanger-like protein